MFIFLCLKRGKTTGLPATREINVVLAQVKDFSEKGGDRNAVLFNEKNSLRRCETFAPFA